ncbi:MAG: ATP-binding protein [Alphaproteobacteria bacterium]
MTVAQQHPLARSGREPATPAPDRRSAAARARHRYFGIVLAASGLIILLGIVVHDLIRGEGAIILGPKSYTAIAFTIILMFAALFLDTRARARLLEIQKRELHRLTDVLQTTVASLKQVNVDLEIAREQAVAANRAKSTFLANMSHEIRTPLNGVLGYAQILARDGSLTARQREMVETISNSGGQLLAILNDILDLSKIEAGAVELRAAEFDLVGLLQGVAATYRARADEKLIGLDVEVPRDPPPAVIGDPVRLRQVLTNLVDNAVRFTDRGDVVLACNRLDGDRYVFAVRDTGIGIPPELQEAVFEPFRQGEEATRRGGTGLGLTICRRQVELMGGRLGLTSQPGRGSTFSFEVPLPAGAAPARERDSRARRILSLADGHAVAALVAVRDRLNRDVLGSLLEGIGCAVTPVEQIADVATGDAAFDVVLVDAPVNASDAESIVARAAALAGPHGVRVIGIGPSDERSALACIKGGFADVLALPVRAEALFACLEYRLEARFASVPVDGPALTGGDADEPVAGPAAIPVALRKRLMDAAHAASVTDLRVAVRELAQLGGSHEPLARRLTALMRNYDMTAVIELLEDDEDGSA